MTISNRIILIATSCLSLKFTLLFCNQMHSSTLSPEHTLTTKEPSGQTLNINNLFTDLKTYKKLYGGWHAGHLYEHMVWVAKAMQKMFNEKSKWLDGIDPAHERIMIIAAFMHDIGKAGDTKRLYTTKRKHPETGFEYILNIRPFYLDDEKTKTYDFNQWAKELNLTEQERATIAVLVGMHQEFVSVVMGLKKQGSTSQLFTKYLDTLDTYVEKSNYNNGITNEEILRMSLAVFRADLCGMHQVNCTIDCFQDITDEPETLKTSAIPFADSIDIVGYTTAQTLIEFFKNNKKFAHIKRKSKTLIV